jgi:hypothetical protein
LTNLSTASGSVGMLGMYVKLGKVYADAVREEGLLEGAKEELVTTTLRLGWTLISFLLLQSPIMGHKHQDISLLFPRDPSV